MRELCCCCVLFFFLCTFQLFTQKTKEEKIAHRKSEISSLNSFPFCICPSDFVRMRIFDGFPSHQNISVFIFTALKRTTILIVKLDFIFRPHVKQITPIRNSLKIHSRDLQKHTGLVNSSKQTELCSSFSMDG